MQDKIIILKCPKCEKDMPLKMSDFMQHLNGKENEYLSISRRCINCNTGLELVCKAAFFVKTNECKNFNLDSFYSKRK